MQDVLCKIHRAGVEACAGGPKRKLLGCRSSLTLPGMRSMRINRAPCRRYSQASQPSAPLRPEIAALKGRCDIPRKDVITEGPLRALNSMFNRADPVKVGQQAPIGWHLLYFRAFEQLSKDLASDGYESWHGPGGPFKHLMWGGARLRIHAPAYVGQSVSLHSEVEDVTVKPSKQGEMVFVNVKLTARSDEKLLLTEERDFIYRMSRLPPSAAKEAKDEPLSDLLFSHVFEPDPIMLFRYSSLTWNSHRIHYDIAFANKEEGYPNTLVHGPLTFTCLAEALRWHMPEAAKRVGSFNYRAVAPLLNEKPFTVAAQSSQEPNTLKMYALDHTNRPAMLATIKLVPP